MRFTPGCPTSRVLRQAVPCIKYAIYLFIYLFSLFAFSRAAPAAYGGSQARGLIGAAATGLRHSHSHTGSEPRL